MTIADLKPYPAMKDYGVPWLGPIPTSWSLVRNGRLFVERKETGFADLPILEVSLRSGVRVRRFDGDARKQLMSDRDKYKRACAGDLAYNMMRMWQGAVGLAPVDGLVSPAYVVARSFADVVACYFAYLFRTDSYMGEVDQYSRGIVKDRNRLYWDQFKQMPSACPPAEEQAAIVRFLDHADRRIRRYIQAKQKLIKLLEEQKQAIIHCAVTRGLAPNVRLKPSGVEWVEDVPAHWEVVALKRVLRRLVDCEHKTAPAVEDSQYRVVRTTAVRQGRLRWEGTYCTTEKAFVQWTQRASPEPGDVVFTREAPAGEACVIPEGEAVCLGQRTVLMKVQRATYDPQFLVHMIYAGPPRQRIHLASQGSTVGHFNMDDIGWMHVLRPPLAEQRMILDAIRQQTGGLDQASARAEIEITLLGEYRTRLIADVVTGKLDVREAAATLPDEADGPEPRDEATAIDKDDAVDGADLDATEEEDEA